MASSIGIAALEAEIVSRKRNANQASAMAAPLTVPKKKSKLKMKYDRNKEPPKPSKTNMSGSASEIGENTDMSDTKSSYSEAAVSKKHSLYSNFSSWMLYIIE